eukprot:6771228-Pyramimonas_sp.AAC.1
MLLAFPLCASWHHACPSWPPLARALRGPISALRGPSPCGPVAALRVPAAALGGPPRWPPLALRGP